ncbi:MAG: TetR family transcriptional regulator [Acidimicrobiia bacterium]
MASQTRRQRNASGRASREELVLVAEKLFAEEGIEAVSFRRVSLAAGQLGNGAVQYYFPDRDALTMAIMNLRAGGHDEMRTELLDQLEGLDRIPIRGVVEALVRPVATHIDAPNDHYVSFLDRYYAFFEYGPPIGENPFAPGMNRLNAAARAALPEVAPDVVDRRMALIIRWMVSALAGIERAARGGRLQGTVDEAVDEVIDLLTAAFSR